MEILVLSDSHGKVDHMVRAVEQFHPGRCCIWGTASGTLRRWSGNSPSCR